MAQLIPTTPIQGSSPEQIRLFNVLKRLPEEFVITQRLPVLHEPVPDFMLVRANQPIFLSVSRATPQDAMRAQQPDLFGGEANNVGVEEDSTLTTFISSLDLQEKLPTAVLFPNLSAKQMQAIRPVTAHADWVSKEQLSPDRFHT